MWTASQDGFPTNFKTPFPIINAVLQRKQEGSIFEYSGHPDSLFAIHKAGFSYLQILESSLQRETLDFLLASEKIPNYFHIYAASPQMISYCTEQSGLVNIKVRERIQLKVESDRLMAAQPKIEQNGMTINRITHNNFDALGVFNLELEKRYWSSQKDFLDNGFGFFLTDENGLPASICYAAALAENTAEIDVATLPQFQQMGLAQLVVGEFVRFCSGQNIVANWDCFVDNQGSLKTALRVGFVEKFRYTLLSIFNKAKKS